MPVSSVLLIAIQSILNCDHIFIFAFINSDILISMEKPKRRRRLATPPPDDSTAPVEDIYDQGVSNAFNDLKSVKELLPLSSLESCHSQSSESVEDNSLRDSSLVDLSDSAPELAEVNDRFEEEASADVVSAITNSLECGPSPPPPPLVTHTRKRRLGSGVKAAFKKLDQIQSCIQQSYDDDMHQQVPCVADTPSSTTHHGSRVKVRVKMPSGVEKYELANTDCLYDIREQVARRESVGAARVSMFYNDSLVTETDTVLSLGLTVADTVEIYILAGDQEITCNNGADSGITIKVQGKGGQRDVETVSIGPDESMDVLMKKFAKIKGLDGTSLTFQFDGDFISSSDTPTTLGIEDGDCVDVSGY
ncbi:NFATC2-interacting protein-like [Watersipora subatra]|uniref:NFATC2-interacting protein-like n=1 Tax=Watersipora subatra TaxID=2589382 RepID=UPI00355B1FBE